MNYPKTSDVKSLNGLSKKGWGKKHLSKIRRNATKRDLLVVEK